MSWWLDQKETARTISIFVSKSSASWSVFKQSHVDIIWNRQLFLESSNDRCEKEAHFIIFFKKFLLLKRKNWFDPVI